LRKKDFEKAIEALKAFEKKEPSLKAKAATNLSFLYFLEGDIAAADKYANLAVQNDRYNAKALVNKGNCLMVQGELERAKELFLEAIGVEADCSEAIFNLGLVNRKLGKPHEALQAFEKLHSIIPNSPEVIFHIANLCDQLGNFRAATKVCILLFCSCCNHPSRYSCMCCVCVLFACLLVVGAEYILAGWLWQPSFLPPSEYELHHQQYKYANLMTSRVE
jgi:intraflagellar transport protein 88